MRQATKVALERLRKKRPEFALLQEGAFLRDLEVIEKDLEISEEICRAAMRHAKNVAVLEAQIEALKEANKELASDANKAEAKLLAIVGVLGEKKFAELLAVETFEKAAKGAQDAADEMRKKIEGTKGGKA
jgi:septum formation topological specificity factor MinE